MGRMKIYLIGIGGIAMCGVAGILKESGFKVYGSEKERIYPPSSEVLEKLKISIYRFDPKNIEKIKPSAIIVGNSIKRNHPEILLAQELGIPLYSFPKFLMKFILKNKKIILCAGTHGKSSVSGLLGYTLEILGMDPTYLVGAVLKHNFLNYRIGKSFWAVLEGDEYPASFFDKKAKFLYYNPFSIILTALEYDHADVYPDIESLKDTFKELIKLVPKEGIIVYNKDDENLKELLKSNDFEAKVISYGKNSLADFVLLKSETTFEKEKFINKVVVDTPFQKNLEFVLNLPGEYNALNALSVIALLYGLELHFCDWKFAFENFPGIRRRQEVLYSNHNLVVIDDFAHHPTAVKETLKELIKSIKPERTVVIFEPRTNSSKRKIFQEEYVNSLSFADEIYLKIPPGLETIPEIERIDMCYLSQSLKNKGKEVYFLKDKFPNFKNVLQKTLIVFMSSAYFEEIKKLEEYFKNEG